MFRKLGKFFLTACLLLGITGGMSACSLVGDDPSTGGQQTPPITNTPVTENAVTIKTIKAVETPVEEVSTMNLRKLSAPRKLNADSSENDSIMTLSEEDNINYIIIYKSQTDITFTITLDNPEAYGIDALRVYCDDENAQIQVDGEFKPIAQELDGTRVINWASEDPYTKTYNIRTTSEDAINSFKVVDVRLAGHDKFQSKETNSTDLGNNELHIYKMDEDAYTLNVIENTFEYIKFNFNVKDEYKDIISNIRVDGLEMDEELGYWMLEESKDVSITYDYYLEEYDVKVSREDETSELLLLEIIPDVNTNIYGAGIDQNATPFLVFHSSVSYDNFKIYENNIPINLDIIFEHTSNYTSMYYDIKSDTIKTVTLEYATLIRINKNVLFRDLLTYFEFYDTYFKDKEYELGFTNIFGEIDYERASEYSKEQYQTYVNSYESCIRFKIFNKYYIPRLYFFDTGVYIVDIVEDTNGF